MDVREVSHPLPFMNCARVCRCQTHHMLHVAGLAQVTSELDRFVTIISAIVHDLGHFGLNNSFLNRTLCCRVGLCQEWRRVFVAVRRHAPLMTARVPCVLGANNRD